MNEERINTLRKFIEENPEDPFNYYGLGVEYQKDDPEKAAELFNEILEKFPDYLPTYLTFGQLLENHGDEETALLVYGKGVILAKEQSNEKAAKELQSFYDMLNLD